MTHETDAGHPFDLATLSDWMHAEPFEVDGDRIQAYAEATNDASPSARSGSVAPPVFAVLPPWDLMADVTLRTAPEEARRWIVHGEHDLWLHRPLEAGMRVDVRGTAVGVHPKRSGTTVVMVSETHDQDGRLLNRQYSTQFYRGVISTDGQGEPAPEHAMPHECAERPPDAEVTYGVDDDQTDRYADVSGDRFPIHLDDEAAKAVGLPGRIVHGLCVLAFAGRAILELEGRDVQDMRRLAARFSKPVFPGARLITRMWRIGEDSGSPTLAFDARTDDGTVVLSDGLAVLGDLPAAG
jgi:acyl dehydratase